MRKAIPTLILSCISFVPVPVSAAALCSVSAPRAGGAVELLVPIVLDVSGVGGARYSTELALTNRGATTADVTLTYTASTSFSGRGSGTVSVGLGAGRQEILPDVIAFLRSAGLEIPADGSDQGGTLRIAFSGVSSADDVSVVARTTTPSGSGRAGLAYSGLRLDEVNGYHSVQTATSWLYGLRENEADRTNVALINASVSSSLILRVSVFNANGLGAFRGPDITLEPGQWMQISRILSGSSFSEGFARIDVMAGTGPYYAYAVFNDNITNDGSFVPLEADVLPAEPRLLPALVETNVYRSELVLVNAYPVSQTITLEYVESLSPGLGRGGSTSVTLGPAQQRIIPDAIEFLRKQGLAIGPRGAASYAGSLAAIAWRNGQISDAFVGARASAPARQGGQYGVFYPAQGLSEGAADHAWVFGLVSNASVRSNLAVADMGDKGSGMTFHLEIYDGSTGLLVAESEDYSLDPGGWMQINDVLRLFRTKNGYIRIVKTKGSDHFTAYGVVNDGETPTSGATNDGSYIAFRNR